MLPIPFEIHIDPMERLLLINIENDPDRVYVGFEPQVFADKTHGTGHIVIGWRADGRVDVFHQPTVTLDPHTYNITGQGLAHMASREMPEAFYTVEPAGVHASYSFTDLEGRSVRLRIKEQNPRARRPFGLLAPMGHAATHPSSLPLVLLHNFYFVRQAYTTMEISIDSRSHRPDSLPLPLDGSRMYFSRYSPDPLIVTLNPAADAPLLHLDPAPDEPALSTDSAAYGLSWSNGTPALRSIERKHGHHTVTLAFEPAFPNLAVSPDAETAVPGTPMMPLRGHWTFCGHPSTGQVGGEYIVEPAEGGWHIRLLPTDGWTPQPTSLTLRFLFRVAKIFRDWPKTYAWDALITQGEERQLRMRSSWKRL